MAVTAVYEFPIPAPIDAQFTHGEKALSVSTPIGNTSGRQVFFLSKYFDLLGGDYVIKIYGVDAATVISTSDDESQRTLASVKSSDGVILVEAFLPQGRQRLGVILAHLQTGTSPCWVAFSLFRGDRLIYTSEKTGWVFDTQPVPASSVPSPGDRRRTLPVFSMLPNWADGIMERLEWSTDIIDGQSDEEQRRPIRLHARRSFEANFLRVGFQRSMLDNFLIGVGASEMLMPMWHEQFRLRVELTIAATTVNFPADTLEHREFEVGGLVLIMDKDPKKFEVLEVESVNLTADTVVFVQGPANHWPVGARIIPLKVARILESSSMTSSTDIVARAQIRFSLTEPETFWPASWGYCAPLWRFPVDRGTDIQFTFSRDYFELDAESGPRSFMDLSDNARVGSRYAVKFFGRSKLATFRAFANKAMGRAMRFYMPSLLSDIPPVSSSGLTTLDIQGCGLSDYLLSNQDVRMLLAVEFNDGRPSMYRNILRVDRLDPTDPVQEIERITFDQVMPVFPSQAVRRMSFMLPMRLDQDAIDLKHEVDESAAVTTSLVMRSTEIEGMPPIECFVTSRPYPLTPTDGLAVTATIAAGSLSVIRFPVEGISVSFALTAGTLQSTLKNYAMQPEALDVSFELLSGTLQSTLKNYAMQPEALDVSFAMTAGNLKTALVVAFYAPEAISVSFELVGGSLS